MPNDRAHTSHDARFPDQVSTLAATDPELIEVFDNFAFDEVLQWSTLDDRLRTMAVPYVGMARVLDFLHITTRNSPRGE